MRINNIIHLDYNDVLIKPSNLYLSRNDVNLIRKFIFLLLNKLKYSNYCL